MSHVYRRRLNVYDITAGTHEHTHTHTPHKHKTPINSDRVSNQLVIYIWILPQYTHVNQTWMAVQFRIICRDKYCSRASSNGALRAAPSFCLPFRAPRCHYIARRVGYEPCACNRYRRVTQHTMTHRSNSIEAAIIIRYKWLCCKEIPSLWQAVQGLFCALHTEYNNIKVTMGAFGFRSWPVPSEFLCLWQFRGNNGILCFR